MLRNEKPDASNTKVIGEKKVHTSDPGEMKPEDSEFSAKNNETDPEGENKEFDGEAGPDDETDEPASDTDETADAEPQSRLKKHMVHQGDLLAKIFPGKQGKPGKDVFASPIKPKNPFQCPILADRGVVKKETAFYAVISGKPRIENGIRLVIDPIEDKKEVRTISRNINDDTKDRYALDAVVLNGSVTPEGVLRCRSLILNGFLKGWVVSSGDVELKGLALQTSLKKRIRRF